MFNYYLTNYAYGEEYKKIQDNLVEKASQSKFRAAVPVTREMFETSNLYLEHKEFFDLKSIRAGHAWCSWKPYVIRSVMEQLSDNDILVYMDVGDVWYDELFDFMDNHFQHNEILVPDSPHEINKMWTTRDCFIEMDCNEEKYWNINQVEAGFCGFKVNDNTKKFCEIWLHYCLNNNGVAVKDNLETPHHGEPNFPEFKEHRTDQSILTNLLAKYNINPVEGNHFKTQCIRCNVTI